MKKKKLKLHYSGKESKRFWDIINNKLPPDNQDAAYSLGVALQNLEGQVIKYILNNGGRRYIKK
jgi:hypothetical protein